MDAYSQIHIFAERQTQWAIKAVYPHCRLICDFDTLASAADHDFILMQINSLQEIQELLWNKIRIQWRKLSPLIMLGYDAEDEFFSEPNSLVFQERIYEYRYIALPFSLDKLFKAISEMQPIYDEKTLASQVRRYASLKGLIKTHLHHLKNAIHRNDVPGCQHEFNNIASLSRLGGLENISAAISLFQKNSTIKHASKIYPQINELIDEP